MVPEQLSSSKSLRRHNELKEREHDEIELTILGKLFKIRKVAEFSPIDLETCKPKLVKVWSYSKMKSIYRTLHKDTKGVIREGNPRDSPT